MTRPSPIPGWKPIVPAAPETVAEARRLFETTELAQAEIAARVGLSRASIGRMAKRGGWRRPGAIAARRALVASLRAKAETAVEKAMRVVDLEGGDDATERKTRMLASLARTLRDLVNLDEGETRASRPGARRKMTETERDDAVVDPDALRRELAERLRRLHRERSL